MSHREKRNPEFEVAQLLQTVRDAAQCSRDSSTMKLAVRQHLRPSQAGGANRFGALHRDVVGAAGLTGTWPHRRSGIFTALRAPPLPWPARSVDSSCCCPRRLVLSRPALSDERSSCTLFRRTLERPQPMRYQAKSSIVVNMTCLTGL